MRDLSILHLWIHLWMKCGRKRKPTRNVRLCPTFSAIFTGVCINPVDIKEFSGIGRPSRGWEGAAQRVVEPFSLNPLAVAVEARAGKEHAALVIVEVRLGGVELAEGGQAAEADDSIFQGVSFLRW